MFFTSCGTDCICISHLNLQVDEMMGKAAVAMSRYMKSVSMLSFLLIEAPSLVLNPPLTLTRSDRHRLRTYIEALNTRLGQLQCQRH
uniref:Uncharacterized protein n=2 Tax=Arundo donax TaxID=35708 RepID=A0A0A9DSC4_ARUDO